MEDMSNFEKELLNDMNVRANAIVKIENLLMELKLPMNKQALYEFEMEELEALYNLLNSAKENRKKYGTFETNG